MKIAIKTLKITGLVILTLVCLIGVYLLSAYVLSRISVDRESQTQSDVPVYILTNGVHTDLVVPIKNEQIDWSQEVKFVNTTGKDSLFEYVAFGWGDKGFYLETPTWADLKASTAFKAAFALSTSAIHATFYKSMREGADCVKINISKEQYSRLIKYIQESFTTDSQGHLMYIQTNANYGKEDAFYEAKGSYHIFHTCNTWANNGLKSCGQKASLWTPFDTGIFYQYTSK
ncbi:TIGR02117 family protein [Emticicia sp. BO119]|uniref:TIGR02117 family protein n=1 Tax=Emticicia sp. BO119 TaxID=2757768 RepID=UPI001E58FFDB|nr:TIGR02117 family protein [Emticicia sp. BO119]